jgi:hypothetical protein
MDKLLRLYWQLKTLRSQDPTCLDFLSPEELAQLEKMLGSVQKVADSPSGSKIMQTLDMPDKAGIGNKGMRKDIDPRLPVLKEGFVSKPIEVEVTNYIPLGVGEIPYEKLDGVSKQTLAKGTRIYITKNTGDIWDASLDDYSMQSFKIPKTHFLQTIKNSAELANSELKANVQILTEFTADPRGKTPIATIKQTTFIEWSNTDTALHAHLETFIETIWAKLSIPNSNPKKTNSNVSATCTLTIPANVAAGAYVQPLGFNFTRIVIGEAGDSLLLVEQLAATKPEDTSITPAEKLKAEEVKEKYEIQFNAKGTTPMKPEEQLLVLEALSLLPENVLRLTKGLKIQKFSEDERTAYEANKKKFKNADVGGFYDVSTNRIVITTPTLQNISKLGFGGEGTDDYNTWLQYVVLHETGHLVDLKPKPEKVKKHREKLLAISQKYKTDYDASKTNIDQSKAKLQFDEACKKIISDFGETITFSTHSGDDSTTFLHKKFMSLTDPNWEEQSKTQQTPFLKSVKADGKTPTDYASTNNKEAFAECFALYFIFPSKLKTLSPNVFNWFKENESKF